MAKIKPDVMASYIGAVAAVFGFSRFNSFNHFDFFEKDCKRDYEVVEERVE